MAKVDLKVVVKTSGHVELRGVESSQRWKGEQIFETFKNLIQANKYLNQHKYQFELIQEKPKKRIFKSDDSTALSCDISGQQALLREKQERLEARFDYWAAKFNLPNTEEEHQFCVAALNYLSDQGISSKIKINGFCAYAINKKPRSRYQLKQLFKELQ